MLRSCQVIPRRFAAGDLFWVDGLPCPLGFIEAGRTLAFDGSRFWLPSSLRPQAAAHFLRWYKHQAASAITPLISHWSGKTGLIPTRVTYNSAKRRWGSATSRKTMNFSFRLAMVPLEMAEYIVVHEFAHFVHMNHSARFWRQVGTWLPDYATKDRWIRQNGWRFNWEF